MTCAACGAAAETYWEFVISIYKIASIVRGGGGARIRNCIYRCGLCCGEYILYIKILIQFPQT